MPKKTTFEEGHEAGYELGEEEFRDITPLEFGRIAYLLSQDWTISHESGGKLIYKIANKVKQEAFEE